MTEAIQHIPEQVQPAPEREERRMRGISISEANPELTVFQTIVGPTESIGLNKSDLAPLIMADKEGKLRRTATLAECSIFIAMGQGAQTDTFLEFDTLFADIDEEKVRLLGNISIMHPRLSPLAMLRGLSNNPEAAEIKATEVHDLIDRTIVMTTMTEHDDLHMLTFIGPEEQGNLGTACITTNAERTSLEIAMVTEDTLRSVATQKRSIIGWIGVNNSGDTVVSGSKVYGKGLESPLTCMMFSTVDRPDFPQEIDAELATSTNEELLHHIGRLAASDAPAKLSLVKPSEPTIDKPVDTPEPTQSLTANKVETAREPLPVIPSNTGIHFVPLAEPIVKQRWTSRFKS